MFCALRHSESSFQEREYAFEMASSGMEMELQRK